MLRRYSSLDGYRIITSGRSLRLASRELRDVFSVDIFLCLD
jgi:hypothetical protein